AASPVGDANEPSATHSPLNSRRFSNLISLLFIRSLRPRQTFSVAKWFLYSAGARKAAAEESIHLNGHSAVFDRNSVRFWAQSRRNRRFGECPLVGGKADIKHLLLEVY